MKWVWLIAIVGGLWWWLRQTNASTRPAQAAPSPKASGDTQRQIGPTVVVPCALCGTHVPMAESIASTYSSERFCCEAHRIELQKRKRPIADHG